jgi:hypothetical protein
MLPHGQAVHMKSANIYVQRFWSRSLRRNGIAASLTYQIASLFRTTRAVVYPRGVAGGSV